jgi:hypothetical protein
MKNKRFSGQRTEATPPTEAELEAARREKALAERWLGEIARGHPAVKNWRLRLAKAEKVLARAAQGS